MIKLKWPQNPSPFWYGTGRSKHVGRVCADGRVDAESDILEVLEGRLPRIGTELVVIKHSDFLTAETVAEYQARCTAEAEQRQAEALANRELQAQRYREMKEQRQHQAEVENAKLHIPVRWTAGLKTVVSGLSKNSNGTGENRRSVAHILLLDPLLDGSLNRPARSFLCTSAKGTNGQAWTGNLHTHDVGNHGPYVSQVTCKQCLKLAQRWADRQTWVQPELILE